MLLLAGAPEATIGSVGKGMGISLGWASRVVEELRQAGLVITERAGQDRRVIYVQLTDAAAARVQDLLEARRALVRDALAGMRPAEHQALDRFLQGLATGLAHLATQPA